MVRPSVRSTTRSSSVTRTARARAIASTVKVLMPGLHELVALRNYELLALSQLLTPEAAGPGQCDGLQPELCEPAFALDMNMDWFSPFVAIKEETVGSHLLDCWHSGGPTSPTIDIIPPQPILSFHVVLLAEAGDLLGDQPLRYLGGHFARHLPPGARHGVPDLVGDLLPDGRRPLLQEELLGADGEAPRDLLVEAALLGGEEVGELRFQPPGQLRDQLGQGPDDGLGGRCRLHARRASRARGRGHGLGPFLLPAGLDEAEPLLERVEDARGGPPVQQDAPVRRDAHRRRAGAAGQGAWEGGGAPPSEGAHHWTSTDWTNQSCRWRNRATVSSRCGSAPASRLMRSGRMWRTSG